MRPRPIVREGSESLGECFSPRNGMCLKGGQRFFPWKYSSAAAGGDRANVVARGEGAMKRGEMPGFIWGEISSKQARSSCVNKPHLACGVTSARWAEAVQPWPAVLEDEAVSRDLRIV